MNVVELYKLTVVSNPAIQTVRWLGVVPLVPRAGTTIYELNTPAFCRQVFSPSDTGFRTQSCTECGGSPFHISVGGDAIHLQALESASTRCVVIARVGNSGKRSTAESASQSELALC